MEHWLSNHNREGAWWNWSFSLGEIIISFAVKQLHRNAASEPPWDSLREIPWNLVYLFLLRFNSCLLHYEHEICESRVLTGRVWRGTFLCSYHAKAQSSSLFPGVAPYCAVNSEAGNHQGSQQSPLLASHLPKSLLVVLHRCTAPEHVFVSVLAAKRKYTDTHSCSSYCLWPCWNKKLFPAKSLTLAANFIVINTDLLKHQDYRRLNYRVYLPRYSLAVIMKEVYSGKVNEASMFLTIW